MLMLTPSLLGMLSSSSLDVMMRLPTVPKERQIRRHLELDVPPKAFVNTSFYPRSEVMIISSVVDLL